MNTSELVEWQIRDNENGLVMPWWTESFLNELKKWDLSNKTWLEFGGGRSTAWLRKKCLWVDTIEANSEWAHQAVNDCNSVGLYNGSINCKDLPDGIQERKNEYFELIPKNKKYDIISVDGIWRYECLQWALNHFKSDGGIIIADNWQQDYVWISPIAEDLMRPFTINRFVEERHTNHEGKPWNTSYWKIFNT